VPLVAGFSTTRLIAKGAGNSGGAGA